MSLYDDVQELQDQVDQMATTPIPFPPSQDITDNLWYGLQDSKIIFGTITLSGGTATVNDARVLATSFGLVSALAITSYSVNVVGGTGGGAVTIPAQYQIACTNGSFTITSSYNGDSTVVSYLIFI